MPWVEVDDTGQACGMAEQDSDATPPRGHSHLDAKKQKAQSQSETPDPTLQLSLSPHQASGLREVLGILQLLALLCLHICYPEQFTCPEAAASPASASKVPTGGAGL